MLCARALRNQTSIVSGLLTHSWFLHAAKSQGKKEKSVEKRARKEDNKYIQQQLRWVRRPKTPSVLSSHCHCYTGNFAMNKLPALTAPAPPTCS